MRKKDPSIVASIGITIVLALALAGVGYYYIDKQHQKELQSIESNQAENPVSPSENQDLSSDASDSQKSTDQSQNTTDQSSQDIKNWKTYSNKTYGFSFKYPSNTTLSSVGLTSDDTDSPEQQILDGEKLLFYVNYMTIDDYKNSGNTDLFQLTIDKFAQEYYTRTASNKNLDGNQVGKINSIKVGTENGYSFTTSTGFDGPWGGSSENQPSTHVFLENNIDKIVITYPTGNKTAESILSTLVLE